MVSALALNMPLQAVVGNVDVTDSGEEKGTLNADMICKKALEQRYDSPSDDTHAENTGALTGMFSQAVNPEGKNVREHDGVEKSHQQNRHHGHVTGRQYGDHYQCKSGKGIKRKDFTRLYSSKDPASNESARHR